MAQTKAGGKKAALTNKLKYGDDFYVRIGGMPHYRMGGFGKDKEFARRMGKIGGSISKRRKKV